MRVGLSGIEFWRIIHARTEELLARHLAILNVHQVQRVSANFFRRKARFVMTWTRLFQPHDLPVAFWAYDNSLEVEEVFVISLGIERLHADDPFAFVDVHFGREVRIFHPPQTPLRDL